MTTHTLTLTAEQMEDIFDAINVASVHYDQKFVAAKNLLGSHDWRVSSADKMTAFEQRRDLFNQRWVEFYQLVKVARKGGAA